ncbi:MAG TPA: hypothetical protein VEY67_04070, partial [Candidatus Dormibacteraeota bacterium]|nr:hypothetical protein [Candidatus Dormibacteraeota bacterium]
EQAVAFVEQALTVTDDPSDRATSALVDALLATGGVAEALTILEPMAAELEARVVAEPSAVPGPETIALMGRIARAYSMADQQPLALEWTDRLLPLAERLDLVEDIAYGWLGRMRGLAERSRESLVLVRAALDLALTHDLLTTEARARTILTFMEVSVDPRAGLAEARDGLERARRLGSRLYALSMVGNGVDCAFRVGEWDWAIGTLREWLEADLSTSGRIELGSDLIRFLACRGEDVTMLAEEIDPLVAAISDLQYTAYRWLAEGWRQLAAGELAAARDAVRRAMDASAIFPTVGGALEARAGLWRGDVMEARAGLARIEDHGMRGPAVDADRATIRAGIAALEGDVGEASALYREALERWRDLGLAWEEALGAIDMAQLLGPDGAGVREAADAARVVLGRLGAAPFLARLEAAMLDERAGRGATGPGRTREPVPTEARA